MGKELIELLEEKEMDNISDLVENVNISKNSNEEIEIELEFKKEQTKDDAATIKRFLIDICKKIQQEYRGEENE